MRIGRWMSGVLSVIAVALGMRATAQPVITPWPEAEAGTTGPVLVASAGVSGVYAVVEPMGGARVYDVRGNVLMALTRTQLLAGVSGDPSTIAIAGAAMSESGRLLFLAFRDTAGASNAVNDWVSVVHVDAFAPIRRVVNASFGPASVGPVAIAHFQGRLYVGTENTGSASTDSHTLRVFDATTSALANGSASVFLTQLQTIPRTSPITGVAIDRAARRVFFSSGSSVLRLTINLSGSVTTTPTLLANAGGNVTGLAWGDVYGGTLQRGLFIKQASGPLLLVPANLTGGSATPQGYSADPSIMTATGMSATADGAMMLATPNGPRLMRDGTDASLTLDAWMSDEVRQVINFGKGLISPDGEPDGWVIDADTIPSVPRFHPASPDAAAWTVLLSILGDELFDDADARAKVRTILSRHAGRLPGPMPRRSADGVFIHWIDPATGGIHAWGDPWATMSTMKIALAAARAMKRWSDDPEISASARAIICGVRNWDDYLNFNGGRVAFSGLESGGPNGSWFPAFSEAILFVEQAAIYSGPNQDLIYDHWRNRNVLPFAQYASVGPRVSGDGNYFQSAFVSLYSMLVQADLRNSAAWRSQWDAIRTSHAMWTDDNGPRWFTVFSAGTTRGEWGGYSADSLSDTEGKISTFTSLMALAGRPGPSGQAGIGWPDAVAAYHAYRTGARQAFHGGSSILYRRSSEPGFMTYTPDSAGLPDVALGALGLAELIRPGVAAELYQGSYPACGCAADVARAGQRRGRDGQTTADDIIVFIGAFFGQDTVVADVAGPGQSDVPDGQLTADDLIVFVGKFFAGCL